jgi:diaminopimelate epimerase
MNRDAMGRMHFFKMTGTGNDFILIDNRQRLIDADNCREFVRQVCRHKLSVGADGLILIENDSEVDFRWRFFNADASEAEMCGNGARCAARFAYLTGIVDKPRMAFRTLAGIIKAELLDIKVKVQMISPHGLLMDLKTQAAGRSFNLDFINTGVPHAVWFAADEKELEAADVLRWGHDLRFHERFQPAGTNVDFVYVYDQNHIAVRTYERGVEGETLACGTGAIASALISAARKRVVSPVEVKTRSGELLMIYFQLSRNSKRADDIEFIEFKEVCLEGEARVAYEADLWPETI